MDVVYVCPSENSWSCTGDNKCYIFLDGQWRAFPKLAAIDFCEEAAPETISEDELLGLLEHI